MKAIVFDGKLKVAELPPPKIRRGDALIRITLAGICNTDVEIVKGYMDFHGVIGHEFVGYVEKCADGKLMGRRVVGEINAGCGKCAYCRSGLSRHCPHRTVTGIAGRDGAFADYLSIPEINLHYVPESVSDLQAVFTEPVAACFEILDQVKISPARHVAVIGDGKLGALAAQVIATRTENVILLGKHKVKLTRLRKSFSFKTGDADSQQPASFDIVIECSGSASGLETAARLLKPRGTLVLKSTFHEKPCIDTAPWVINEITIVGSRCGRFKPALAALKSGTVNPLPLIDAIFPASDAPRAFKRAQAHGVFKVLLDFRK